MSHKIMLSCFIMGSVFRVIWIILIHLLMAAYLYIDDDCPSVPQWWSISQPSIKICQLQFVILQPCSGHCSSNKNKGQNTKCSGNKACLFMCRGSVQSCKILLVIPMWYYTSQACTTKHVEIINLCCFSGLSVNKQMLKFRRMGINKF